MPRTKTYGPSLKAFYTGPFFDRDPLLTFAENARRFIDLVMDDAYEAALSSMPPRRSGAYAAALQRGIGLRSKSLSGKQWRMTTNLSTRALAAPFPTSRSGRPYFNYAGRVERKYHTFRKARSRVYSARKHNRELIKGLT